MSKELNTYKFVSRVAGTYEGNDYDNVELSNGIRTCKFKNYSGKTFDSLVQGQNVEAFFKIVFAKDAVARVGLLDLKEV